jgi:hypothetical protein
LNSTEDRTSVSLDITAYAKLTRGIGIQLDEDGEPSREDWQTFTKSFLASTDGSLTTCKPTGS